MASLRLAASLAAGRSVKLSSFGSFGIRKKGERVGRNPKTGKEVPITPRRVLVFRPSNIMKQRINAFGLLLGGVPSLDDDDSEDNEKSLVEEVLRGARNDLELLNRKLCV